jgi:hypothetical protein
MLGDLNKAVGKKPQELSRTLEPRQEEKQMKVDSFMIASTAPVNSTGHQNGHQTS